MVNTRTPSRFLSQSLLAMVSFLIISGGIVMAQGSSIPASPEFTSPDIKPTFADWLTAHPLALAKKMALTDPLLKPPFAAAPVDSLKGMAAGIRAVQLDAPNRVKAVQYLGTVDCVTYPQAQDMLIDTMKNDPSEEVRYEAVMALRNMLTRGCCNMDTACECPSCCNRKKIARQTDAHAKKGQKALIKEAKGPAKKIAKKFSKESQEQRYDCCRGCANEKVMKALAKVASEKDDQCCWVEPSERVRAAAMDGMCLFKNYVDGYSLPPEIPETEKDEKNPDGKKHREVDATDEMEADPDSKSETDEAVPPKKGNNDPGTTKSRPTSIPSVVTQRPSPAPQTLPPSPAIAPVPGPSIPPVVAGLRGRCIVGLKSRQILPVDPQYSSVFEERTYYFSSAEAKTAFDESPKDYAPAYGGIDPVAWLTSHKMVDGQFLREFEGQFFLFATKENWETFKGTPNRYVLRREESNLRTVAGSQ